MITENQAIKIAEPHLAKEENSIVFVNQYGLYWLNSDKDRMEQYFLGKKEKYWIFESNTPSKEEQPVKKTRK